MYLKASVHLEEVEVAVLVNQHLNSAGRLVVVPHQEVLVQTEAEDAQTEAAEAEEGCLPQLKYLTW